MTEANPEQVEALIARWHKHEDAIRQIKAELAQLLQVQDVRADSDTRPVSVSNGTVGPKTKGKRCLEALQSLGGRGRAREIADKIHDNAPSADDIKRLRSQLTYLAKPQNKYIRSSRTRGVWELTEKGTAVLRGT